MSWRGNYEDFYGIVKTSVLQEWLKDFPVPSDVPDAAEHDKEYELEVEQ
jgi:hypothetical protein